MKFKNFIWYTGIWTYPPLAALFHLLVTTLAEDFSISSVFGIVITFGVPLLFPILITFTNIERQQRGQTDFSFAATYGLAAKDERHSKAYLDAAYPDIPAQYSSKIPIAATYTVNPFYMLIDNGFYYVMTYNGKKVWTYRIDRMKDVRELTTPREYEKEFKENVDITNYTQRVFSMFGGQRDK